MNDTYRFREFEIPDYMMDGMRNYIEHGVPPGSFLTAVICNDLFEACGHADDTNLRNIPAYCSYFYSEAPPQCWGSSEKMHAWMTRKAAQRAAA